MIPIGAKKTSFIYSGSKKCLFICLNNNQVIMVCFIIIKLKFDCLIINILVHKMKYNKLPHTDIEVSKICLGTMTFGEQNSEKEAHDQLDCALDMGVNFLDTAELYAVPSTKENNGKTEDYIGSWIAKTGKRDKYIIATKVCGPASNRAYISDNLGFSKERVNHAINRSLKRLRTDYVDLYQLHWPERKVNSFGTLGYTHDPSDPWQDNFAEVIDTLNDLIKSGKIRHWGISNETPWGTMKWLSESDKKNLRGPITIQNPYNLVNRSFEVGLAEVAMREEIGLLAYSPLAMGMLSGKYHRHEDRPTDRLNKYDYFKRYRSASTYEAVRQYLKIAEENGLTLTQLSLGFVNTRPYVTSNIIGATTLSQLKENIATIDVTISDELESQINQIHAAISNPAP